MIGSLFSGIGGLELGLERAGWGTTAWQVECDSFCRTVLKKHWPHTERFPDVKTFTPQAPVDVICGGFPCQDVSAAGRGAGLAGERSGLWSEFRRVVELAEPPCVVVENVASGARRWLPHVRRDLHVLGYRTRAVAISAFDVGAPHRRARVFVLATHPNRQGELQQGRPVGSQWGWSRDSRGAWTVEPPVCGVAHGVPRRMDRLRALGNAVVPACAEVAGLMLREWVGLVPLTTEREVG